MPDDSEPAGTMYEVEMKFPAASQRVPLDRAGFTARMAALGAQRIGVQTERDVYFAHPCRDFARTDEALRLRRVGNDWQLTYKGPLVDSETKTRTELQTRLDAAAADTVRGILERLGFRPVREVRKRRELWAIEHAGRRFTISWDEVDELGRFVEIETLADERQRAEATAALKRLAETLGLTHSERRSYLCLLLEQDADGGKSTPSGD